MYVCTHVVHLLATTFLLLHVHLCLLFLRRELSEEEGARCGDRLGTINDMYNLDVLST